MSVSSKATTSALSYRPDIDGLRAIAVLAVLFFHADLGFVPGATFTPPGSVMDAKPVNTSEAVLALLAIGV